MSVYNGIHEPAARSEIAFNSRRINNLQRRPARPRPLPADNTSKYFPFTIAIAILIFVQIPLLSGCAHVTRPPPTPLPRPAGPLEKIRRIADRCQNLDQYRLILIRQERRGLPLLERLTAPERIACWFRREPFSVRMRWLDPEVKYGESTFVAGQNANRVRFRPRRGPLGLPPLTVHVDPMTPVHWGEARYPVTEFGLEKLMHRTLTSLEEAGPAARVIDAGIVTVPLLDRPGLGFRIDYPSGFASARTQELFVDPVTLLPLGARLTRPDGELEALYLYDELQLDVNLTNDDFLLEAERSPNPAAP